MIYVCAYFSSFHRTLINFEFGFQCTEKKHDEKALNVAGNSLSTECTSFEKRFIILPIGVWSKNSIGAWRIFVNRKLCVNRADLSVPTNSDNVATNVAKTVNYTKGKHKKICT